MPTVLITGSLCSLYDCAYHKKFMFVSLLDSIVRNLGNQIRKEKRRAVAQNRAALIEVFLK